MTDPARTSPDKPRSVWSLLMRKPVALAAAGVVGASLLGAYAIPNSNTALAQSVAGPTIQTPFGRAPLTFADLVEKVRPAVVSVQVKNGGKKQESGSRDFKGLPELPDDHPLNEFFKRFNKKADPNQRQQPSQPSLAQGSGFIISSDGYVVTNHHVVEKASEIILTLDNGDEHKAKVIGSDQRTDLALLKIKSDKKFPFVEFSGKKARVGDWVLAVGNPFGLGGTVTAGIVSAHNRDIGSGPYDYLQIDAAVNRGNSGGPAFNLEGQVVGVNTAIFSPSGGNVGIAFAVPAALAKKVIAQLKDDGKVARGWLGVTIQNVTEDIGLSLGLKEPKGAIITKLSRNGPASKSDLEVGDVIVRVDDEAISDSRDLARTIAEIDPDTRIKVRVLRDGSEKVVAVKLGTFPSGKQLAALQADKPVVPEKKEYLGMKLAPASEQSGAGDEGVVITSVDPGSKAAEKGLKAGDVILEVAGLAVTKPKDVADGVEKAKKRGRGAVNLLVRSGNRQRFVAIPLKKT